MKTTNCQYLAFLLLCGLIVLPQPANAFLENLFGSNSAGQDAFESRVEACMSQDPEWHSIVSIVDVDLTTEVLEGRTLNAWDRENRVIGPNYAPEGEPYLNAYQHSMEEEAAAIIREFSTRENIIANRAEIAQRLFPLFDAKVPENQDFAIELLDRQQGLSLSYKNGSYRISNSIRTAEFSDDEPGGFATTPRSIDRGILGFTNHYINFTGTSPQVDYACFFDCELVFAHVTEKTNFDLLDMREAVILFQINDRININNGHNNGAVLWIASGEDYENYEVDATIRRLYYSNVDYYPQSIYAQEVFANRFPDAEIHIYDMEALYRDCVGLGILGSRPFPRRLVDSETGNVQILTEDEILQEGLIVHEHAN